jgi:hypothetical protein
MISFQALSPLGEGKKDPLVACAPVFKHDLIAVRDRLLRPFTGFEPEQA